MKRELDLQQPKAEPRFVELVRVSTKGQADRDTPEAQRQALDRLRENRPGLAVERIEALAVSGAVPLADSDAGRRLSGLAKERRFNELRLFDVDRALGARADSPTDRLAILNLALEAGAVIVDTNGRVIDPADESGMGELDFYLRTFFAKQERRRILKRTEAGKHRVALSGGWSGGGKVPYGLSWDKKKGWSIEPEPAKVVAEIFSSIANGESARQVAIKLNSRGVSAPRGGRWWESTILHMVKGRYYVGELHCEGVRLQVPGIVSEEMWQQAREVWEKRAISGRPRQKEDALCAGRILCPCGCRMHVKPQYSSSSKARTLYYRCATRDVNRRLRGDKLCAYQAPWHRADQVDEAVWALLCQALSDKEVLRQELELGRTEAKQGSGFASEVERCELLLQQLSKAEQEITRAFRRGRLSQEAWEKHLEEMASERRTLERTRETARRAVEAREAELGALQDLEAEIDLLRARLPATSIADRRAILKAIVPEGPPFGITLWGDGRFEVRGALRLRTEAPAPAIVNSSLSRTAHYCGSGNAVTTRAFRLVGRVEGRGRRRP